MFISLRRSLPRSKRRALPRNPPNLKFGGLAYHLWHREEERASLPKNDLLLRQTIESRAVRCENGMKECCGKSE